MGFPNIIFPISARYLSFSGKISVNLEQRNDPYISAVYLKGEILR